MNVSAPAQGGQAQAQLQTQAQAQAQAQTLYMPQSFGKADGLHAGGAYGGKGMQPYGNPNWNNGMGMGKGYSYYGKNGK